MQTTQPHGRPGLRRHFCAPEVDYILPTAASFERCKHWKKQAVQVAPELSAHLWPITQTRPCNMQMTSLEQRSSNGTKRPGRILCALTSCNKQTEMCPTRRWHQNAVAGNWVSTHALACIVDYGLLSASVACQRMPPKHSILSRYNTIVRALAVAGCQFMVLTILCIKDARKYIFSHHPNARSN
jgi:hypothetical protein